METNKVKSLESAKNELLVDEKDLFRMTKISPRTWQLWRRTGDGPKFVSISSKMVRYRMEDVNAWIAARVVNSTGESKK